MILALFHCQKMHKIPLIPTFFIAQSFLKKNKEAKGANYRQVKNIFRLNNFSKKT